MKTDIRAIVTDKIIAGLEKGEIPWKRPWKDGFAVNHVRNTPYRGLNQFVLTFVADSNGWVNRWVTFKTIASKGWRLKKGEHGTAISFFTFITDEDDADVRFPLLRYYTVFSLSQLEEMPEIPSTENKEFSVIDRAEQLIQKYVDRPSVSMSGDSAYYSPTNDRITLPVPSKFNSDELYYSTYFHELGHSTGHAKRLARKGIVEFDRFGSEQYGVEELIAEFTCAFLCAEAQIEQAVIENTTAYIQNWLKVLKNDRQMLLTAASQAQKASDYILGVKFTQQADA